MRVATDLYKYQLSTKQQGFSVVELMIATLLGLFIIGGIISVFISSSESYRIQQALSEVQEKGRFALRKIRVDIQRAGYYIDPEEDEVALIWETTGAPVDFGANAKNVLSIYRRAEGDSSSTIHRTSYFTVGNKLMRNFVTDMSLPKPSDNEELINGISRLSFRFGIDISSEEGVVGDEVTRSIDWVPVAIGPPVIYKSYLSASELTGLTEFSAAEAWNKVRSVQVELVIASDTKFVVESPQLINLPTPYSAASEAAAYGLNVNDRQYFQAYTSTFALRNRVQ